MTRRTRLVLLYVLYLAALAALAALDFVWGPFPYFIGGSMVLTAAVVLVVLVVMFALFVLVREIYSRVRRGRERKRLARLAELERLRVLEEPTFEIPIRFQGIEEQPWLPEMEPPSPPPLTVSRHGRIRDMIRNAWVWLKGKLEGKFEEKSPWERLFSGRGFLLGFGVSLLAPTFFFFVVPWYYAIWLVLGFVAFGIAGLIKIDIGFKGVPTWLGGRLTKQKELPSNEGMPKRTVVKSIFELKEGWNWILPRPLMGAEAIDVREQSTEVSKFTVVALGSVSPDKPEDISGVRVTIEPSTIRWRFDEPAQTLSIGEAVIKQSLVELIQNTLRQEVSRLSDIEALQTTKELREKIQTEADAKADDWGMKVISFLMGEISLPEEVHKDYEKLRREERQRKAERLELDHVRDRLIELIAMGYTRERAQEIVQTERGKVKKEVRENQISISPETGQVIERVANLFRR